MEVSPPTVNFLSNNIVDTYGTIAAAQGEREALKILPKLVKNLSVLNFSGSSNSSQERMISLMFHAVQRSKYQNEDM